MLFFISALVLVALKPPSLRIGDRPELFNVDHKPITDGLSKLPATYDGVRTERRPTKDAACRRACRNLTPWRRTADDAEAGREGPARPHGRPGPREPGVLPPAS